ncbi:Fibrinogen-like protein A,Angiopoietin-4,Angiopoietin-1,Fibrinogen beta chain,Tenascin-X,Fibrinogen C domain-containing protein 1-A,Angiopoietin-2,Microfibril-associated glycoprotein 4,Fibroleukin,Angiopoietin-related protein 1,Tenascin-R,Tenascin,Fibrinogen C domain-containing protein 1-B,Fibrinogen C domain-containing protein 1 [Mytilus coruscus]|uniref:Fibrinogen C-terminal domain-containing protein n=1 Tax=Mytilus coruscus TaxID=42192 RepID=A0A6J8E2S4_MYTCO|nr:Fibrinogen-like protein A,Angiopoietin-4,Angiopoietin-1,Fibrinogen beta chain,Tenascin-X,Fibrinogen C domain-containing protein 1-A,Angiopoietin-2,Microfibril-associated glycoprotein 4,Fibroleukin,Angiopoietin-related protein 1,Tenascin-R,Tenascin,Fibrinogen C domain-containing protein 1-B,Fibrinogen C domain-containing protein 1 [Mytilus coruscus]
MFMKFARVFVLYCVKKTFDFLAINRVLNPLPKDCSDLRTESCSDVYIIQPFNSLNITVFCEMETDAGGWTIIQTRFDGSINFFRSWNDYKKGFGDVAGEHWIGNDNLHNILQQRTYKVRFDLEDFTGDTAYAIYDTFHTGDEGANYNLSISGYNGTAGKLANHSVIL